MNQFTLEEVWRTIDSLKAEGIWERWAEHERREEGFADLQTAILRTIRELGLAKTLNEAVDLTIIMRRVLRHELGLWIGEASEREFGRFFVRP
jgi:hypothetical protein